MSFLLHVMTKNKIGQLWQRFRPANRVNAFLRHGFNPVYNDHLVDYQ